jgi:hypothetical protein
MDLNTSDTAAARSFYGRLATAQDPCGAQFKLMAPNAQMPGA